MENYKWIDGFAIASKLYYKLGHLDIADGVVTNSGFPIGKWLQWNRDNIGSLSLYDIYDLSSMGMIWSKNLLGNHRNFAKNYERLKKYKRFDEKLNIESITEPDLKKWASDLIIWRRLEDNALLTLREVDMLDELSFNWGNGFAKTRKEEENSRKAKLEFFIDGMRKAYYDNTRVVYREAENTSRLKEKVANTALNKNQTQSKTVIQRVEVPVKSNKWHDVLIESYLANTSANDEAISAYKLVIGKGKSITGREAEFIKFLSRDNNGLALWLIKKKEWIEIPSLMTAIVELKEWIELLNKAQIEISWSNEQYTINGYNVASLVYRILTEFELIESGSYSVTNRVTLDYIVNPYKEMQRKSPIRFLGKILEFHEGKGLPQLEDFRKLYKAKKEKDEIERKILKEKEKRLKKERELQEKEAKENERMRIREAHDKAKKDLEDRQKKEKDALEDKHKKEKENLKVNVKPAGLINFDSAASVNKAVHELRSAVKQYGYIPFYINEIDSNQLNKVILSLNNYGIDAFDADTIYRFEKNGYIFYTGEIDEQLINIKKIFCKFVKETLDGHDVKTEHADFIKLSNILRRTTDKTTREFIKGQLYEMADSVYPVIGEFKAAIKDVDKKSKKYEAVTRMKEVIKEKISAKRYIS